MNRIAAAVVWCLPVLAALAHGAQAAQQPSAAAAVASPPPRYVQNEQLLRRVVAECSQRQETVLQLDAAARQLLVLPSLPASVPCPVADIALRGAERSVATCTDAAFYMLHLGARILPLLPEPEMRDYSARCGAATARLFVSPSIYSEWLSSGGASLHIMQVSSGRLFQVHEQQYASMDLFLCQTRSCQRLMQCYAAQRGFQGRVWFTGHASSDVLVAEPAAWDAGDSSGSSSQEEDQQEEGRQQEPLAQLHRHELATLQQQQLRKLQQLVGGQQLGPLPPWRQFLADERSSGGGSSSDEAAEATAFVGVAARAAAPYQPIQAHASPQPQPDYSQFLHVQPATAGTQHTTQLLQCWASHPEFPLLTVVGAHDIADTQTTAAMQAHNVLLLPQPVQDARQRAAVDSIAQRLASAAQAAAAARRAGAAAKALSQTNTAAAKQAAADKAARKAASREAALSFVLVNKPPPKRKAPKAAGASPAAASSSSSSDGRVSSGGGVSSSRSSSRGKLRSSAAGSVTRGSSTVSKPGSVSSKKKTAQAGRAAAAAAAADAHKAAEQAAAAATAAAAKAAVLQAAAAAAEAVAAAEAAGDAGEAGSAKAEAAVPKLSKSKATIAATPTAGRAHQLTSEQNRAASGRSASAGGKSISKQGKQKQGQQVQVARPAMPSGFQQLLHQQAGSHQHSTAESQSSGNSTQAALSAVQSTAVRAALPQSFQQLLHKRSEAAALPSEQQAGDAAFPQRRKLLQQLAARLRQQQHDGMPNTRRYHATAAANITAAEARPLSVRGHSRLLLASSPHPYDFAFAQLKWLPVPLQRQELLSFDTLRLLQANIGLHIAPSFGHALNEARAAGALVVTTDHEPESELVQHLQTGLLVTPSSQAGSQHDEWQALGQLAGEQGLEARLAAGDLCLAVQQVLALPMEQRVQLGGAARRQFLADKSTFVRRMRLLRQFLDRWRQRDVTATAGSTEAAAASWQAAAKEHQQPAGHRQQQQQMQQQRQPL